MELSLTSPIQYVPGVGPAKARLLEKLGIGTVEDLLFYVPFRYNDFSLTSPIDNAQVGEVVTLRTRVASMKSFVTKNGKKIQQAILNDDTGTINAVWFNQPYLVRVILPGSEVNVAGEVSWFGRKRTLVSPQYEIMTQDDAHTLHTGRLVPVYPETAGITSKWLRGRIHFVLTRLLSSVRDRLPEPLRTEHRLMDLREALSAVHFPKDRTAADNARRRLSFDEMFLILLRAYRNRRQRETTQHASRIPSDQNAIDLFIRSLPFTLTDDQTRTVGEILTDMNRTVPMNRLLVGDVGAGKTVVAAVAMYAAAMRKFRSVLMAPTEILAKQHFQTISSYLSPMGVRIGLFTGSTGKKKQKRENGDAQTRFSISDDAPDILVGTHALLSESVPFRNVGLTIIDEQQRFGVAQRTKLRMKGKRTVTPHLLTMTATPIPRTVALTLYGNLDLSMLTMMPKGRKPVTTWVVPNTKREGAYQWIREQVTKTATQAFIVCPLIEESETLTSVRAASHEYERLSREVFSRLRLGLLHGRMKEHAKDTVLTAFRIRMLDILVTTPVVEVGIDITNATIMLIEAAERFGLAQLHQLRGRVGRGDLPSYCLLFTEHDDEQTLVRLKALEKTHSGPVLAQIDLTLRGPGEIFGTKQHGIPALKVARFSDTSLIEETQRAVASVTRHDPDLSDHPDLRDMLERSTIPGSSQD